VDKGVLVAEKLGRFQVPDLNKKISKVNHLFVIKKS
jgi:hypothetical protein